MVVLDVDGWKERFDVKNTHTFVFSSFFGFRISLFQCSGLLACIYVLVVPVISHPAWTMGIELLRLFFFPTMSYFLQLLPGTIANRTKVLLVKIGKYTGFVCTVGSI